MVPDSTRSVQGQMEYGMELVRMRKGLKMECEMVLEKYLELQKGLEKELENQLDFEKWMILENGWMIREMVLVNDEMVFAKLKVL